MQPDDLWSLRMQGFGSFFVDLDASHHPRLHRLHLSFLRLFFIRQCLQLFLDLRQSTLRSLQSLVFVIQCHVSLAHVARKSMKVAFLLPLEVCREFERPLSRRQASKSCSFICLCLFQNLQGLFNLVLLMVLDCILLLFGVVLELRSRVFRFLLCLLHFCFLLTILRRLPVDVRHCLLYIFDLLILVIQCLFRLFGALVLILDQLFCFRHAGIVYIVAVYPLLGGLGPITSRGRRESLLPELIQLLPSSFDFGDPVIQIPLQIGSCFRVLSDSLGILVFLCL
mmetsp:Transcript_85795/g.135508  ORF Transcript_85795/g.135508 Transcript_85795/m.135508 type:complete len:282 (-) Transcript_85795:1082-1927(-)